MEADMAEGRLERDLPSVALLTDPVRRALYDAVVASPTPMGRDQAARTVGVSRSLAAFHLDRLAKAGLLETDYARLSGRTGPGAGRTAKLYRPAARAFDVSVPPRDYEVPARLLAEVMSGPNPSPQAARERAHEAGLALGAEIRAGERGRSRARLLAALRASLSERGFRPRPAGPREIRLANCPFDSLSRSYTDLMCGMNHAMLRGVVEGLGEPGLRAELDSQPGMCCVAIRW
jgi:predicted ArsR family transcriptional regulator